MSYPSAVGCDIPKCQCLLRRPNVPLDLYLFLTYPLYGVLPTPRVIRVRPLIFARWPPARFGYYRASTSLTLADNILGPHTLKLAGVALITRGVGSGGDSEFGGRHKPKSLEERKLQIPTTTNITLALHTSFEGTPAACLQISIPLHLHVHTLTSHLQSSDTSVPPPPRRFPCSTSPELPISIPLHFYVSTPAAHLQSSIPLHFYVPTPSAHL